jgi:hypothetical protein
MRGGRTRRAMKLASAFGIGIAGCQPQPAMPRPEQCRPGVPPNAEHPIATRPSLLAGDYELFQVQTQPHAGVVISGRLHLEPLDSTARAGAVGGPVRDLVGWLEPRGKDGAQRAALAPGEQTRAVLAGDHLVLGAVGTLEGYVEHLTITAVAPEGFWGWWKAQSAMELAAGNQGRVLPDPAGYFCALRVSS